MKNEKIEKEKIRNMKHEKEKEKRKINCKYEIEK